jgi:prepilin-type N-terminal cleavage/methylation domain-containing protein
MMRRGMTLLELLIVLAMIVVLAAVSLPAIRQAWQYQQLKQAGDLLRAVCGQTRVKAMRSGQIQMLRVEVGTGRYYVQAWTTNDDSLNASADESLELQSLQLEIDPLHMKQLPEGITFHASNSHFDTRASEIEDTLQQLERGQGTWSLPVLFYPDGSSSFAELTLANEREQAIPLKIRSLTGLCQVGDITTLALIGSDTP